MGADMPAPAPDAEDDEARDLILRRAAQVAQHATYLGFFDWLVWSWSKGFVAPFVFGDAVVDPVELFAPAHAGLRALPPHPHGFAVVVCTGDLREAHYAEDGQARMSHFVLGVPLASGASAPGPAHPPPVAPRPGDPSAPV